MIKIQETGRYQLQLRRLAYRNIHVLAVVKERLKLFRNNPGDTRLKNHALRKRMKGKFAFSITGDLRIVYERIGKNTVRFLAIGGHKEVYGHSPHF